MTYLSCVRIATLLLLVGAAFGAPSPLTTVPKVDLKKYSGIWYEAGRIANRFQRQCVSDVQAQYTLRSDSKIAVLNQCKKKDGQMSTASGTAKVVSEDGSNSKLRVTFFWPFYGNYWIIGLDPEYRFAVVGEPGRDNLWILSRKKHLDPDLYEKALAIARDKGYITARVVKTPQ